MADLFDMSAARFSPCGAYRYTLERRLAGWGAPFLFVMCNPSTATADVDDPTIRRCIGFANRLGARSLTVANLWAYRATDPADLVAAARSGVDIIGPENNAEIAAALDTEPAIVLAWGASIRKVPGGAARAEAVADLLAHHGVVRAPPRSLRCLGRCRTGEPRHPLFVPYTSMLDPYGAANA